MKLESTIGVNWSHLLFGKELSPFGTPIFEYDMRRLILHIIIGYTYISD
jgi:hypothetical protein